MPPLAAIPAALDLRAAAPWLAVVVLALGLVLLVLRRRSGRPAATPPEVTAKPLPAAAESAREGSDYWEPYMTAEGERRRRPRRPGNPIPVDLLGLGGTGAGLGYVLDRSFAGLKLRVSQPAAVGDVLRVRARHAPGGTPWSELVIRWCRPAGTDFELGGDFTEPPPVNVLLLFG